MATMIPADEVDFNHSEAEKRIYGWFKNDPTTRDWVVFHSKHLAEHVKNIEGEIDYLVLAPGLGVYALEVKGGRVKKTADGNWHYINKDNVDTIKKRSPFSQAHDEIFSLMKYLDVHCPDRPRLTNIFFNYAVMMPDIVFDISDPEWTPSQVFDSRNQNFVGKFVIALAKHTRDVYVSKSKDISEKNPLNQNDVDDLVDVLRPLFDLVPTFSSTVFGIEENLVALTQEQYQYLDSAADNPRIVVNGLAGTGKTLLALKTACEPFSGKTALLCYNKNLGDYLAESVKKGKPDFNGYVGTIHSYMLAKVHQYGMTILPEEMAQPDFFDRRLPALFLEGSLSAQNPEIFDRLLIDESQDIITEDNMDVLSCLLGQSLRRSKWIFFGDFSKQAIYQEHPFSSGETAIDYLSNKYNPCFVRLKKNCRNSREICAEIELDTQVKYDSIYRDDPEGLAVEKRTFSSLENEAQQIKETIASLQHRGIDPKSIVLLSPYARNSGNSCLSLLPEYPDFHFGSKGGPFVSTIHAFKGLESNVVLLCDIGEDMIDNNLFYVGLSRGRDLLVVFETPKCKKLIDQMIADTLFK